MRILLANPRGFCAGVQMAVDVVDQVLKLFEDEDVYVYHAIVHNNHVVSRFEERGARFIEDIDDVPEGGVVVFSAHGVPPSVLERAAERRLRAINATCPLVNKVHSEAFRYSKQGYQILLVGHANHQEIIGTRGCAPDVTQVVESPADIPHLKIDDPDMLVYLTQTTLSTDDAAVIINALKEAFPNIKAPPSEDICYATTNRQSAVRQIAPECDLVLVVGSTNSSNSMRLTEIAQNVGTPGKLIDDATHIDWSWFESPEMTVLVTAGASAPEDLVAGVCRSLIKRFGGTIEQRDIHEEKVEFNLPGQLRREMKARGVDSTRRIRVAPPTLSADLYGAVPLTMSAKKD